MRQTLITALSSYDHLSSSSSTIINNTWQYIAGTWNSSNIKFYVNETEFSSSSTLSSIANSAISFYIGRAHSYWFKGNIDEIRVSNVARSSAWTKASYYSGNGNLLTYGTEETIAGYFNYSTLISNNILTGYTSVSSIDSFNYVVSSMPSGTSMRVQFSKDNTNWYSSIGVLNNWDTISTGTHTINLSSLSWSGANFYYKIEFTSDGSNTPVLDEISLNITSH